MSFFAASILDIYLVEYRNSLQTFFSRHLMQLFQIATSRFLKEPLNLVVSLKLKQLNLNLYVFDYLKTSPLTALLLLNGG
jgi:hypothetical protein